MHYTGIQVSYSSVRMTAISYAGIIVSTLGDGRRPYCCNYTGIGKVAQLFGIHEA